MVFIAVFIIFSFLQVCEFSQPCTGLTSLPWSIERTDSKICVTTFDSIKFQKIFDILTDTEPVPLTEVAHGKNAYQSSTLSVWYARNAVDGDVDTMTHTGLDQSPFWFVDLGKSYIVKRVEVLNRKLCCSGNRLHDLDILLGKNSSTQDLQLCAHYKGPAVNGELLVFDCRREMPARYVKLQIKGKEYLHVSEVKVYAYDN